MEQLQTSGSGPRLRFGRGRGRTYVCTSPGMRTAGRFLFARSGFFRFIRFATQFDGCCCCCCVCVARDNTKQKQPTLKRMRCWVRGSTGATINMLNSDYSSGCVSVCVCVCTGALSSFSREAHTTACCGMTLSSAAPAQ